MTIPRHRSTGKWLICRLHVEQEAEPAPVHAADRDGAEVVARSILPQANYTVLTPVVTEG
jgi:hypothetical protein